MVFHERAALKNAIRHVHKVFVFLYPCRHDRDGVTQLFIRMLQAWIFPGGVWQHLTREGLCPFYQAAHTAALASFSGR